MVTAISRTTRVQTTRFIPFKPASPQARLLKRSPPDRWGDTAKGVWSADVTPEVYLRECITCTPLPSTNKVSFETQRRRHQKYKTGISVALQKAFPILGTDPLSIANHTFCQNFRGNKTWTRKKLVHTGGPEVAGVVLGTHSLKLQQLSIRHVIYCISGFMGGGAVPWALLFQFQGVGEFLS